ncbi:hypothetical protein Tco_0923133 [Tanacetum coccineum]|uniref:Uncharacterized protein n=1 Tax=Tanacetum coccineum TaxID=301880 RepID=A0ABQ5D6I2_9ASTR
MQQNIQDKAQKESCMGKVTIPDQKDDWDDDERGGGKILVLQEQFSQNQQDFLDEYLPQWDDQLAIQKHKLEMEWENPFVAKHVEDYTVLHLSKMKRKMMTCHTQSLENLNNWQPKSSINMKSTRSQQLQMIQNLAQAINLHLMQ